MNTTNKANFKFVNPQETVDLYLDNGKVIRGPRRAPVGKFLALLKDTINAPIVGAIVNGELRELTYPIEMDAKVRPVTMGEADGMRIYRRSLVFLLETAFGEIFPESAVRIGHSVAYGGYYCTAIQRPPLSQSEIDQLEHKMKELVQQDIPFERRIVPIEKAREYFQAEGEEDKVRLLAYRQKDYLTLYELKGHCDYHHGYMVPSTGFLRWFKLSPAGEGFTLRFPRRHAPTQILPLPGYPKLRKMFRQYGNWLRLLGISNVGALNDSIKMNRINEVILVSEALHEQRVTEIARQIVERGDQVRVVLIAGPSSSGKTTFAKRLSVQLLAFGLVPFPIEMDNYFVDRHKTPLDENGKPDFESVDALNREALSRDLMRLIAGERIQMPYYDFQTGLSSPGKVVQLLSNEIIILEGIHGLYPDLLPSIPHEQTFRIYVSALTQLNLDRHNRISTTDTRLIRRITRDARNRGYSAQETIQHWESVRRGEKRYIFPYQENADAIFNSALAYEVSALKPFVEPLLRQVSFGTPEYVEAKRLLAFLEWFLPVDSDLIPDNSILREFIGNSILRSFTLWQNHH